MKMKKIVFPILIVTCLASCKEKAPEAIAPINRPAQDHDQSTDQVVGYTEPGTYEETYLYDGQVFNLDMKVTKAENGELESNLIPGVKDYDEFHSLTQGKDLSSVRSLKDFSTVSLYDHTIEGDERQAITFYNSHVKPELRIPYELNPNKEEMEKLSKNSSPLTYNISYPFMTLFDKTYFKRGKKRECRFTNCPDVPPFMTGGSARIMFGNTIYYRERYISGLNNDANVTMLEIDPSAFKPTSGKGFADGYIAYTYMVTRLFKHKNFQGSRKTYVARFVTTERGSTPSRVPFYLGKFKNKASSYSVYVNSKYKKH